MKRYTFFTILLVANLQAVAGETNKGNVTVFLKKQDPEVYKKKSLQVSLNALPRDLKAFVNNMTPEQIAKIDVSFKPFGYTVKNDPELAENLKNKGAAELYGAFFVAAVYKIKNSSKKSN